MKTHDAIAWLGIVMFAGSLWVIHPALTIGVAGILITACAVWISRQSDAKKG